MDLTDYEIVSMNNKTETTVMKSKIFVLATISFWVPAAGNAPTVIITNIFPETWALQISLFVKNYGYTCALQRVIFSM